MSETKKAASNKINNVLNNENEKQKKKAVAFIDDESDSSDDSADDRATQTLLRLFAKKTMAPPPPVTKKPSLKQLMTKSVPTKSSSFSSKPKPTPPPPPPIPVLECSGKDCTAHIQSQSYFVPSCRYKGEHKLCSTCFSKSLVTEPPRCQSCDCPFSQWQVVVPPSAKASSEASAASDTTTEHMTAAFKQSCPTPVPANQPFLVTGATGYIASNVIFKLLSEGATVHATVEDLNHFRVEALNQMAQETTGTLKLFEVTLRQEQKEEEDEDEEDDDEEDEGDEAEEEEQDQENEEEGEEEENKESKNKKKNSKKEDKKEKKKKKKDKDDKDEASDKKEKKKKDKKKDQKKKKSIERNSKAGHDENNVDENAATYDAEAELEKDRPQETFDDDDYDDQEEEEEDPDAALHQAMEGCVYVFHILAPRHPTITILQKFRKFRRRRALRRKLHWPIVEGTAQVCEVASTVPTVKRVILTSSVDACYSDSKDIRRSKDGCLSETVWNHSASLEYRPVAYAQVMAEKRAWKIQQQQDKTKSKEDKKSKEKKNKKDKKSNEENENNNGEGENTHTWDLVRILPGYTLGPSQFNDVDDEEEESARKGGTCMASLSMQPILKFLNKEREIPTMVMPMVDVRDVARAHLEAALRPKARGRYILAKQNTDWFELCQQINRLTKKKKKYGAKYGVPKFRVTRRKFYLLGPRWFPHMERKYIRRSVGLTFPVDGSKAEKELGIHYRPVKFTMVDHFEQLLKSDIIQEIPKGRRPLCWSRKV